MRARWCADLCTTQASSPNKRHAGRGGRGLQRSRGGVQAVASDSCCDTQLSHMKFVHTHLGDEEEEVVGLRLRAGSGCEERAGKGAEHREAGALCSLWRGRRGDSERIGGRGDAEIRDTLSETLSCVFAKKSLGFSSSRGNEIPDLARSETAAVLW